ncbi:MAG: fibrobacter succinogenes major paralogous domain-containing protein [Sphingobacteriaceae bacterium]
MKTTRISMHALGVLFGIIFLGITACKKDKASPTPPPITVTDIDGNTYQTVTIGTQVWMAENLKTTHFRDASLIPEVSSQVTWAGTKKGAMCWYNNDITNKDSHGALYNWYAVTTLAGLAPQGWHIATNADWQTLEDYLIANGYNYDGTKAGNKIAKSVASKTGWNADPTVGNVGNDPNSNNKAGLGLLACGYRDANFGYIGNYGTYWIPQEFDIDNGNSRYLNYNDYSLIFSDQTPKYVGMSVRCVKD